MEPDMSDNTTQPEEVRVGLVLPKSLRDDLKITAIKQDKTLQELATQVFSDYLTKQQEAAA